MTDPAPVHGTVTAAGRPRFRHIRMLTGNDEAWRAKRALIARASTSLDLCYFILEHDATTAALLRDLVEAAGRGVRVRLLLDHFMTVRQTGVLRALANVPGIEVRRFRPPTPEWRQALQALGIDDRRFIEGLTTMDLERMASAFAGNTALSPAFGSIVSAVKADPGEGRFSVALRLRNALVEEVAAEASRLRAELLAADAGGLLDRLLGAGRRLLELPALIDRLDDVRDGLDLFLHRTHHKLLLADGREFIMGGRNMADAYHLEEVPPPGRPFVDTDVQVWDEAGAAEHAASFKSLWDGGLAVDVRAADPTDTGADMALREVLAPAGVQGGAQGAAAGEGADGALALPAADGLIVNNGPSPEGDPQITRAYVERIRAIAARGEGRIDLVSAYVCLVETLQGSADLDLLRQSLLDAAAAGVQVNIYTNSITSTDLPSINAVAYTGLARMIHAGVRVFELADGQGSLHTKAAAIGDDWLLIGSYNLDPRSELYDTNNLLALHDPTGSATRVFRSARVDGLRWTPLDLATVTQLALAHAGDAVKLMWVARVL